MRTCILFIICAFSVINFSLSQELKPAISFEDNPKSYSMHICFDGKLYYSVNGGIAKVGQISLFTIQGVYIQSLPLPIDMRGIVYCERSKCFFFNTTDYKIYKIIDLKAGTYELVFDKLYENKQASIAIDPRSRFLYVFDNGTLSIHKLKKGKLVRTLSGLKCGDGNRKGGATVAIDRKRNIYTWDSDSRTVFKYNKKGKFLKSFKLSKGSFGYSLSYANDMLFVSHSPKNRKGIWYGYKL